MTSTSQRRWSGALCTATAENISFSAKTCTENLSAHRWGDVFLIVYLLPFMHATSYSTGLELFCMYATCCRACSKKITAGTGAAQSVNLCPISALANKFYKWSQRLANCSPQWWACTPLCSALWQKFRKSRILAEGQSSRCHDTCSTSLTFHMNLLFTSQISSYSVIPNSCVATQVLIILWPIKNSCHCSCQFVTYLFNTGIFSCNI